MDDAHRYLCQLRGHLLALQVVTSALVQDLGKTHGDAHARRVIDDAFSVGVWPKGIDRNSPEFVETSDAFEKARSIFTEQLDSSDES